MRHAAPWRHDLYPTAEDGLGGLILMAPESSTDDVVFFFDRGSVSG